MEPALVPFTYSSFWLTVWGSALLSGLLYALLRRAHPFRAGGLALMLVPVWIAIWGFVNSIPALADPESFIPARSTYRLSGTYIRTLLIDFGYLGTGFLLWTHAEGLPKSTSDLARRLRKSGLALGETEGKSMVAGWAWFPALLLGTIALDLFVRNQVPALINGDESQVWANMTVYHALIISAAAGTTEELVYRGVLLVGLVSLLRRVLSERSSVVVAVFLQAIVFGAAHAGYGTLYHVLGPLIFGLIAGAIAVRYGIWAAIVIHTLVDIFAFGIHAANNAPWMLPALWALLLLNVGFSLVVAAKWALSQTKPTV